MPEPQTNSTGIAGSSPVPCSPSFVPFDDSWKKEVMKHRKEDLVEMFKRACNDRDFAMEENRRMLMNLPSATIRRHDDGRIEIVDAPEIFACSREILQQLLARLSSENA